MVTYLDRIVAAHRAAAAADPRPLEPLLEAARAQPAVPGFRAALAAVDGLGVIAEVKRRSPSLGALKDDVDPVALARAYVAGGATCLSVLTDAEFFGGSTEDLVAARSAAAVPVLRKDFTVGEADVADARLMGASAILLIVSALDDVELASFLSLAGELGLDALVEVHDEPELERALVAGATLVGVNQRDLTTFAVDTERAVRMAPQVPVDVVAVAESGVRGVDDARRLAAAGYRAVLVGESLVRAEDPATAVAELRRAGDAASGGRGPVGDRAGSAAEPT